MIASHLNIAAPISKVDQALAERRASPLFAVRGLTHWWSPLSCFTNAGGTTIPTDGQEILRANDLGPGATNATATASNGLTYIENAWRKFPGWKSTDGTNKCLTATGALSSSYQTAFSVYVLMLRTSNGDTIVPVGGSDWYLVRSGDQIGGAMNDLSDTQTDLHANLGILGVAWLTWDGTTRRVGFNGHYIEEAATGTFNPATAVTIGALTSGGFGFDDPFFDVVICNAAHTVTESKAVAAHILSMYGIQSTLVCDGDSIMTGEGSQPLTKYETGLGARIANSLRDYAVANYGVSGQTVSDMNSNRAVTAESNRLPLADQNLCLAFGGTNDIEAGESASTVYARLKTYADAMRDAGFRVIVGTILDRAWGSDGAAKDAVRTELNSRIRASGCDDFDAVADFANIAELSDSTDSTYYMNDGIHPNAAGVALMTSTAVRTIRLLERKS